MKEGIRATKYNFSNSRKVEVVVKISNDGKTLIYEKLDSSKTLWNKFRGSGKLPINQIVSLAYGGMTSTFAQIQEKMVMMHNDNRQPI